MNIFTELPMYEIIQGMLFILEIIAITVLFFSIVHCVQLTTKRTFLRIIRITMILQNNHQKNNHKLFAPNSYHHPLANYMFLQ